MNAVHTNLYTPKALELVQRLPHLIKSKWSSTQMKRIARRLNEAEIAPDGEVILPENNDYCPPSYVWHKNNAEILKWLTIHLKLAVKSHYDWYRMNEAAVDTLTDSDVTIRVQDVYLVYDLWFNRSSINRNYSKSMIDSMIGTKRDPITAELVTAQRAEIKELERKCEAEIQCLRSATYEEIDNMRKAAWEKFGIKEAETRKQYNAKIDELKATALGFQNVATAAG